MTQPALAFNLRGRGRHYPWPAQPIDQLPLNQWGSVNYRDIPAGLTPLPSVTNILGVIDKPALLGWAAEQALTEQRGCGDCGNHKPPKACAKGCDCQPWQHDIAFHKWASNRTRDQRADAGTRAHTLAERLTTDAPLPSHISEEDEAYADAFMQFVTDNDPTWLAVEVTLAHPEAGYAGTADWIAEIDGTVVLGDYKTRGEPLDPKKVERYGLLYDENKAQLAALASATVMYRHMDGAWTVCEDFPRPTVGMGVVLCPDGSYHTETLDGAALRRCFDGFLGALKTWRWLKEDAA